MVNVVLDTNIYVSSIFWKGMSFKIIQKAGVIFGIFCFPKDKGLINNTL